MTAVDGRVQRGTRNREAIVDALLACYEAGDLRPSVPEVAARAGVSIRSVHNHFTDVEALRAEVAERQWERYAPLVGKVSTSDELVASRVIFFEAVTPVRRAALLSVRLHADGLPEMVRSRAAAPLRRLSVDGCAAILRDS